MAHAGNPSLEPCPARCSERLQSRLGEPDSSDAFNYPVWKRSMFHRFPSGKTHANHSTSKDSSVSCRKFKSVIEENPLAGELWHSLETQFSPDVGEKLRCCRDEPFPMPHDEANEMRALLQAVEVTVRLSLERPADESLSRLLAGLRWQFKTLCEKKVVELREGKFSRLLIVMELSAFQMILLRWDRADLSSRCAAIEGAINICQFIHSDASASCLQALNAVLRDPRTLDTELMQLQIRDVVASVPFEFPEACRGALGSIKAAHVEPSGKLTLPSVEKGESTVTLDSTTDSEGDPRTVADVARWMA